MTKFLIPLFIIACLGFMVAGAFKDEKRQCDGKTKTYASMGKVYACPNYKEPNND